MPRRRPALGRDAQTDAARRTRRRTGGIERRWRYHPALAHEVIASPLDAQDVGEADLVDVVARVAATPQALDDLIDAAHVADRHGDETVGVGAEGDVIDADRRAQEVDL